MKKLIIFTQLGGIKNVLGFRTDVVLTGFFQPIIENDFLVYDENKILSKTTSINDGSIFLIKDSISKEDYERFIGNEKSDKIFVLKHQKPTFELQNVTEIYIGRHGPKPRGLHYPEVFEILQDNKEENRLDIIIDTILKSNPKLESALDFLHDCLVKNPENFDTTKLSSFSIEENNKVREYIELMPEKIPEIINSNEYSLYIESYKSLRNELLSTAGV